ncbi:Predicted metalloprotease, contains C-terminal PDZ domain [Belliella buryatensis]|uniref:Predicted metalloprotease, contains C-terminal PDZ domain n=1 Tax=Belliella buryatensis TaxID=1500549 RepID=A0A239GT79_9BACT|nr:M61 family metallopeptidase [Belliella buryatensis]SNS72171.1 Predicted metalloprotease, contains C-terminal PDZ domain [Belliella buryatensis]
MQYFISRNSIPSQFVNFKLKLSCESGEKVKLQLAAWRPGRYELANYAQKIRAFKVCYLSQNIAWEKHNKDCWTFTAKEAGFYEISYEFYANQMDAGGCWSDDVQLYLNFSNCLFEAKDRENEEICIYIDLPENHQVACPLSRQDHTTWIAENYQVAMDSPFLASSNLKHYEFKVDSSRFHLWFNGSIHFDVYELIQVFKRFTQAQIKDFGDFPADDYHYIFQLLPFKHYHGVEHQYSTVITIGADKDLSERTLFKELVGVSSHELYHFWNVCRIRPKELIPYNLVQEIYLNAGLVIEGITTYMGDLYLLKSGYFDLKEYCEEILEKLLQKEFDSFGWKNQSITESSQDLWLDGYKAGIPDKKVSIYNRGAIISLCLDLILIQKGSSLTKVMNIMWERFGKTKIGYTLADFQLIIEDTHGEAREIQDFFDSYVFGVADIFSLLKSNLETIGIQIEEIFREKSSILNNFGIRIDDNGLVTQIHPESEAYNHFMLGDKIIESSRENEDGKSIVFLLERQSRRLTLLLRKTNSLYFPQFKCRIQGETKWRQEWMK